MVDVSSNKFFRGPKSGNVAVVVVVAVSVLTHEILEYIIRSGLF